MASTSDAFTATGNGTDLIVQSGETLRYAVTGSFVGTLVLERGEAGGTSSWEEVASTTTTVSATDLKNNSGSRQRYRWRCSAYTSGTATATMQGQGNQDAREDLDVLDAGFEVRDDADPSKVVRIQASGLTTNTTRTLTAPEATEAATDATIGTVGAAPVSGTIAVTMQRFGKFFVQTFTLDAAQIPVTDGGGSGSHGSLKLFDYAEGSLLYLGSRQDYTAFAEGAALTGGAGDAVFEIGLGTAAIAAAADGALGATEDDIGGDVNVTLSGGTGVGTGHTNSSAVADGTGTATDLNLNWSGTAATIDGDSTIDVTGTITVVGVLMGDD